MNKIQLVTVDSVALAKECARNATNDELLVYPQNPTYVSEEDLFDDEDENCYRPEVQEVFDRWLSFYMNAINNFSVLETVNNDIDKIYLKLDDIDGSHISVISVKENFNTEAMDKIKLAFNEDRNCTVIEITNFQVFEALEGKTAAIQLKYIFEDDFDYDAEDAPEPEQTTIYVSQTWVY